MCGLKGGKVYAAGTEDMDTLTFGTNILLRHLTFREDVKNNLLSVNDKGELPLAVSLT